MSTATDVAIRLLGKLVETWLEQGKDPVVEARRIFSAEAAKARAEAKAAAVVAGKPKRRR